MCKVPFPYFLPIFCHNIYHYLGVKRLTRLSNEEYNYIKNIIIETWDVMSKRKDGGKIMRTKREKFAKQIGMFVALVLVVCAALALSVFAEEPSGIKGNTCYTHGDVNADGVVTSKDAIYLLYHSVNQEEYPIEQDGDFDGDKQKVTKDDAIHLLYSVNGMFGDFFNNYKLKGEIHAYGEPIWQLDTTGSEPVATAYYRCACGQKQAEVVANVTVENEVLPTCTDAGSVTCSLKATYADVEYETTKTVVLNALGHNYGEAKACEERACQNSGCDYIEKAAGHNFDEPVHTVATCTAAEKYTYTCQDCDFTYTEEVGLALGHSLGTSPIREEVVDASNCTYQQIYMCGTCQQEVEGQIVTRHAYKAAITKEATCMAVGEKTYTCTQCDDSYKEDIALGAHVWNAGVVNGTNTKYTCTVCNEIKTTVDTSMQAVGAVTLRNREVESNGTFIKLDEQLVNRLGQTQVQVTAMETDKSTLNLTEEQQAQIGSNPVYDFTMTAGDQEVSNFAAYGEGVGVTVTLPYDLQPGDDVDCIHVWYIDDEGNVAEQPMEGTYSNGYVTFETTHFSYYTVTRLTPAQRCAAYGHSDTTRVIEKTCESDGYTLHVCVRCAETWKDNIQPAEGHKYSTQTTEATCTTAGSKVETCGNCSNERTTVIPATGHNWNEVDSKAATCTAAGYVKATCGNTGCSEEKNETIPQLKHDTTKTEVVATCDTRGYILEECKNCDYEEKTKETDALGHDFEASWKWDEETLSAVLTLACQTENCGHSVVKNAVVDIAKQDLATCSKAGKIVYSASVAYNQTVYSEEWEVVEAKLEHKASEEWAYNSLKHYHTCILCEARVEETAHAFDEGTVKIEPTCTEEGVKTFVCSCGYEKEENISALGHELENNACTRCDFKTDECNHEYLQHGEKEIITDSACGKIYVYYAACECGEVVENYGYEFEVCDAEWTNEPLVDENGYVQIHYTCSCEECGLFIDEYDSWEIDDECVGTCYAAYTITAGNGDVLYTFEGIEYSDNVHPTVVCGEKEDLSTYGLCGGSVTLTTCVCGQNQGVMLDTSACDFVPNMGEDSMNEHSYTCSECGVKQIQASNEEELEKCQRRHTTVYTFYDGETQLCQYQSMETYDSHAVEYSFDMKGDTCAEGYTVNEICQKCDYIDSYYEQPNGDYHYTYYSELDVSEHDLCGDTIEVYACPCGEESWVSYYDCGWSHLDYVDELTEDGIIEINTWKCMQCGLTKTTTRDVALTDEMCVYDIDSTTVYEKDGETILTTHQAERTQEHEYVTTDYKLLGENCEDGVEITRECKNCGSAYTSRGWGHETFTKASYDMADYGMCGGIIEIHGCACGKQEYISESYVDEKSCNWQHLYYNPATNTSVFKCAACGTTRNTSEVQEQISGCLVTWTEKYEYLKGYNVVLSVETVRETYNHKEVHTFKLNGTECSDGYTVFVSCINCDYTNTWTGRTPQGEHATQVTAYYDLADYGFCGGIRRTYSCPCGKQAGIDWETNAGCHWQWYSENNETGTITWKCTTCGGYRSSTETFVSEEGCYRYYQTVETYYDKDMVEKLTLEATSAQSNHNYTYNFTLHGESCSDGYTVHQVCTRCNIEDRYDSMPGMGQHSTYPKQTHNMTDYGFCGGTVVEYECPCGERTSFDWTIPNYCQFSYEGRDEATNTEMHLCRTCGGSYTLRQTETKVDECHTLLQNEYRFYNKEGQEVCSAVETDTYTYHDNEFTFTLYGDSCEAGYLVHRKCKTCGEESDEYNGWHNTYLMETTNLEDYGFCAGIIEKYSCPCGKEEHTNVNSACVWRYEDYDEATRTNTWKCDKCGNWKKGNTIVGEKDENCVYPFTERYQYINQEGEIVYESETSSSRMDHNETYTFEMLGDSCEDGYYVIHNCKDCNYYYREEYLTTHHRSYEVETIDLVEKGMCEGTVWHYKCPCGDSDYYNSDYGCNWQYDGYVEGAEQYSCLNCKTVQRYEYTSEQIDACHTERTSTCRFSNEAGTWFYATTNTEEQHEYVYELRLNNPEGTCEDGYTGVGTCTKCGEIYEVSGNYHEYYVTSYENLADKGMCENIVRVESCACGEYTDAQIESTACYWSQQTTDADGTEHYLCNDCNGTRTISRSEGEKDEECYVQHMTTYTYYNSVGDEVFGYTYTSMSREHDYEITNVEMHGDSCEDGYIVTSTCKDCGRVSANSYAHHGQHEVKVYDLAEYGACEGAQITHSACYCGEYHSWDRSDLYGSCNISYTSNMYKDDDGHRHDVSVYTCEDCGLRFTTDAMTVRDAATCTNMITTEVTIAVGTTAVDAVTYVTTEESHDYQEMAELMEGATNCEDGVIITHTCRDCQDSYTTTSYYHNEVEVADGRIDLSELGSECGGYVAHTSCACGQESSLNLEDADCDFDHEWESAWLGEYYSSQMTTQGTTSGSSTGFMRVCAVTDPEQCGFTIRGCTYYLRDIEHCQLVQYTTWQLGYDRTTGEYKKEITIATGNVLTYHDYVSDSEEIDTTAENDTIKVVSKECSVCGSTHVHTEKENANHYTYYVEDELVNTLDNGENKYLHEINENYLYNEYSYPVLDYRHVSYADDSEYWYRHDYIYDWENFDCTRIHKYSDSEGDDWEKDETCHKIYYYSSPFTQNTCTQYGTNHTYSQCKVCKKYFEDYMEDVRPSGHYWYDSDGDGIYQCSKCGLENINGADGQIIVEDLTESHGEGTAYVVGYYNQNEVQYTYYVGVICNDLAKDDENYEIVLDGVAFTELTREENGINAISFGKEEAQSLVAAAVEEAGYTGDYDLRFAFVPVGSDGDFDYAITFTDETIEE